MTDLDRALHDTLTRAVDDDVQVERLLAGARAAGTRYRRRRTLLAAAGGLTAGATALILTMTVLGGTGGPSSAPASSVAASSASPSVAGPIAPGTWPVPPEAAGTPTAAASADEVGRPLRLHLSLTRPPFPLVAVQYQQLVDTRQENLLVSGADRLVTVRLGVSTQDFERLDGSSGPVDVGGRPGTFAAESGVLRWQTANGLWLQVAGARDRAAAVAIAESVRIDRTFRCVVPYRLGPLPAGVKPTSCSMTFTDGGVGVTGLGLSDGRFHAVVGTGTGTFGEPTEVIDGRPARANEHPGDGGEQILELAVDRGGDVYVDVTASGRWDRDVVRRLMTDLVWVGGADPAAWPADPLG